MATLKKTYYVVEDGVVIHDYAKAGSTVELYPSQAKYMLPPYSTQLSETPPVPESAAEETAPSPRKSR